MRTLGYRLATLALLIGLPGCGGGIPEGIPPGAGQTLTPEQQKDLERLSAEEEAESKAAGKTNRGP